MNCNYTLQCTQLLWEFTRILESLVKSAIFPSEKIESQIDCGQILTFFVKYRGACRLTNNVSNSLWTCNLIITIKTCYTIIIHKRIYVWFHLNNLCLKLWTLVIFHILQRLKIFSMNHGHYVCFFCLQPLLANARLDIMHLQVYEIGAKKWCHFMKKQELTVNLRWW